VTITRPTKQQARSERSTNAMLEAASELIVEGGFASVTFAAVGERAGYSRGLVTARFGSKEGLVEALIERIVNTWNHRNVLPRTRGKSGLDGLAILIEAIWRQSEVNPRGLRVLYSLMFEALGPDESLRTRFAEFHVVMRTDFARMVAKGKRDGSIRSDVEPAREAALIIAAMRGIGYQWLLDPENFDPVDSFACLHDVTVSRLSALSDSESPALVPIMERNVAT
jgi:AcrR family transcriptional regulator